MQAPRKIQGHIYITSDVEAALEHFQKELHPCRVVTFFEENFKIEHAKQVVKEAYISESDTKYICIAAKEFTNVAQNALLKILEEPPLNIEFILITLTKSNLLPTVRSRLPIVQDAKKLQQQTVALSLGRLDYAEVFAFLKEHARVDKNSAKALVEALFYKATVEEKLILTPQQLEDFDQAYRLLDLNSRPQSVLAMLLMGFSGERG
jgi:DNA polymerase-3 subunit delta'